MRGDFDGQRTGALLAQLASVRPSSTASGVV
jgi:hypothetical protein